MKAAQSHGLVKYFFPIFGRLPCFLPPTFHPGKILISTTGIARYYSGSIPDYNSKFKKYKGIQI